MSVKIGKIGICLNRWISFARQKCVLIDPYKYMIAEFGSPGNPLFFNSSAEIV